MPNTLKTYCLIITLSLSHFTSAEVILDGTLGNANTLIGPHFAIKADLGKQVGNNLFHSFEHFNLKANESATFSGPANISHVISRVTGGQASFINGLLHSNIAEADIYFLNPAGILFGEQARLDIQGSLYISTADYLRLGDEGAYHARYPDKSLLTVAPPTAFGFLTESPASIEKQDSFLSVPNGKRLSFIGGDLTLQDHHKTGEENARLSAPDGRINLVSMASSGEVPLNPESLESDAIKQFGTITITDIPTTRENIARGANIDVSGHQGGSVYMRGGRIIMEHAYVFADTQGSENGQGISINASDEIITKGTRITTEVLKNSTGNGGDIQLTAGKITLSDGAQIASSTRSAGKGGDISLTATEDIRLSGFFSLFINGKQFDFASGLLSNSTHTGQAGQILVSAPTISLTHKSAIRADSKGFGDAGNISLQTETLTLQNRAQINVNTGTPSAMRGTGNGGKLAITAKRAVLISGEGSGLASNTFTAGSGGLITLKAPLLEVREKGTIQADSQYKGKGGEIFLDVDTLYIREKGSISSKTWGEGLGGHIGVKAHNISLTEESLLNAESIGTASSRAGDIHLDFEESLRLQNSAIKTESISADGGDIHINSKGYLYLINSDISSSVQAIEGDGGNLKLIPEFIVLDKSRLKADASRGKGGNIQISTTGIYNFSKEPRKEIITASSELGIDGEINVESPDINLDEFIVVLSDHFFEAKTLKSCSLHKRLEEVSRFHIKTMFDKIPQRYPF